MNDIFQFLGFGGAVIVAGAYIPQIYHLFKEHCAYGISVRAWLLWLIADLMIIPSALISKEPIFIALLAIQAIATTIVIAFAYKHSGPICPKHLNWFR